MQHYLRECTTLADKHYLVFFMFATADQISSRLPPARPALVPFARITLTQIQSIFFPSADCNTLHIPSPEDTSNLITGYRVAYPSPLQVSSSCSLGPFSFFSSFGRFSSFLCGLREISLSLVWRFWTESTDIITHWCTGLDRLARSVSQFCCLCCPGRLVCPGMPTKIYNYTERTRIAARATEGNRLARRNDKLADCSAFFNFFKLDKMPDVPVE
jgi:hypothetical protein